MMGIRLGRDVANEDRRRLREIRSDRHADQAAFPRRLDRQLNERFGQQFAVLDDPQRTGLLADEDTAVGSDFECRHAGEPGRDDLGLEPIRQRKRGPN